MYLDMLLERAAEALDLFLQLFNTKRVRASIGPLLSQIRLVDVQKVHHGVTIFCVAVYRLDPAVCLTEKLGCRIFTARMNLAVQIQACQVDCRCEACEPRVVVGFPHPYLAPFLDADMAQGLQIGISNVVTKAEQRCAVLEREFVAAVEDWLSLVVDLTVETEDQGAQDGS